MLLLLAAASTIDAQQRPQQPRTARARAAFDPTGNWVSYVTEEWRFRMVTPPKGDYNGVPLKEEGRKLMNAWDLAQDKASGNECRAFGAPAIMRLPARFQITWQDDDTLKIDIDSGQQTRLLRFNVVPPPPEERTWQGLSRAEWRKQPQANGGLGAFNLTPPASFVGGNLKVVTTNLRAGYLRKNGVPYSENAVVTEYFNRHVDGDVEWLNVITVVEDPRYLELPFVTSTSLRKEPDGSKWNPTPCQIDPPREAQ